MGVTRQTGCSGAAWLPGEALTSKFHLDVTAQPDQSRCQWERIGPYEIDAHPMRKDRCLNVRGTSYSIAVPKAIDDAGEPDDALIFLAELSSDLAGMLNSRRGREYYWFSLGAVAGRLSCGAFSHFIGWANDREGWELRVPSLVNPKKVLEIRDVIPCLVVEGVRQFAIWSALGGHALVERHTTEELMPDMLEPMTCAPDASGSGFVGVSILTDQDLQRSIKEAAYANTAPR